MDGALQYPPRLPVLDEGARAARLRSAVGADAGTDCGVGDASAGLSGKTGLLFTQIKRFKPAEPGVRMRDPREGQRLWEFSARLAATARASGL